MFNGILNDKVSDTTGDDSSKKAGTKNHFQIHKSLSCHIISSLSLPQILHMNLHEYQAKELLKKYNVPVQDGIAVSTPHEAEEAYRQIKTEYGSSFAVVKAQIHAGGRGKGKIKETGINGVKVVKSLDELSDVAQKIIGGTLVTINRRSR